MIWTSLSEDLFFVDEEDEYSVRCPLSEGDDDDDKASTTIGKFRVVKDVDSIIIVGLHLSAFNIFKGFITIDHDFSTSVKRCQNKKLLSQLRRPAGFDEAGEISNSGNSFRRFFEFALCGWGEERIYVLVELEEDMVDVTTEEDHDGDEEDNSDVRRNRTGRRPRRPFSFFKLRESYLQDVVIPSLAGLSTDSLTQMNFGNQLGEACPEKLSLHSSDWESFASNVNLRADQWRRSNRIRSSKFYVATHGRRFSLNDARGYIEKIVNTRAVEHQLQVQIHYAETVVPCSMTARVGGDGGACFIDLDNLEREVDRMFITRNTFHTVAPYGLKNAGYFRGALRVDEYGEDEFLWSSSSSSSKPEGIFEIFRGGDTKVSYIQVYDPSIHIFDRSWRLNRDQVVAHSFLLALHTERARQQTYISNAESLKRDGHVAMQKFQNFIDRSSTTGNAMRVEVVLNFRSTTSEGLKFLLRDRGEGGGGGGGIADDSPCLMRYLSRKKLIVACVGGWRNHVLSTGGHFFQVLQDEYSCTRWHANDATYYGGYEYRFFEDDDDDNEGGDGKEDEEDPRHSTRHLMYRECFQYVYDAELRLLQWLHGSIEKINGDRWSAQIRKDPLACKYRKQRGGGGLRRHSNENMTPAAASQKCKRVLLLLNYVPFRKVPGLTRCPENILHRDNVLEGISHWIWSTLPNAISRFDIERSRGATDTGENNYRIEFSEVERLILCHGLRYSSRVGLNLPQTARGAFALERIWNPCHRKKTHMKISGAISVKKVENWILGSDNDENWRSATAAVLSIEDIMRQAIVSDPRRPSFRLELSGYIKNHVEAFPDLDADGGQKFYFWKIVGSEERSRIWKNALSILKNELSVPPKILKTLPRDVSEIWQSEIIEVLIKRTQQRYRHAMSSMVAFVVIINIMENVHRSQRNINYANWARFMEKSNVPIHFLKSLGFVTTGDVYETVGGIEGPEDWKKVLESRYVRDVLLLLFHDDDDDNRQDVQQTNDGRRPEQAAASLVVVEAVSSSEIDKSARGSNLRTGRNTTAATTTTTNTDKSSIGRKAANTRVEGNVAAGAATITGTAGSRRRGGGGGSCTATSTGGLITAADPIYSTGDSSRSRSGSNGAESRGKKKSEKSETKLMMPPPAPPPSRSLSNVKVAKSPANNQSSRNENNGDVHQETSRLTPPRSSPLRSSPVTVTRQKSKNSAKRKGGITTTTTTSSLAGDGTPPEQTSRKRSVAWNSFDHGQREKSQKREGTGSRSCSAGSVGGGGSSSVGGGGSSSSNADIDIEEGEILE